MDFGILTSKPIRFFELADQPWFPVYLREKVQEMLTLFWTHRLPVIQPATPADLAASVISTAVDYLESVQTSEVVVVDFCSGGGGPVPLIERVVNSERRRYNARPLRFILTDLHPHVQAWSAIKQKTPHIDYISQSVDASNAPSEAVNGGPGRARVFRLFCLSFHHFDDQLASKILQDCFAKSDGFAIIELQSRTLSTLILMALYWPTILYATLFWVPIDLGLLFFTFIIPVIPFALVFDGIVSSLRTRTFEEVLRLIDNQMISQNGNEQHNVAHQEWAFESGWKMHTWPIGYMNWIVGKRKA